MATRSKQLIVGFVSSASAAAIALALTSATGLHLRTNQAGAAVHSQTAAHGAIAGADGRVLSGFSVLHNSGIRAAPPASIAAFRSLHTGSYANAKTVAPGMYLAENNGALCAWVDGGLGGCTDHLNGGDSWIAGDMIREWDSDTAPFRVHLYGFARDQVAAVRFTTTGGQRVAAEVNNNAFSTTLDETSFPEIIGVDLIYRNGRAIALDPANYFPRQMPHIQIP